MISKNESLSSISPVPLYAQMKEILRARIFNNTYKAHEQLPSESELTRSFGISRITVRQALGDLQKEGLVFKIHGKGTYVTQPKAFQNIGKLQGFGEAMASMGYETFSQVISFKILPADKTVSEKLGMNENEMVSEIRRVRYLNRAPISLDVSYLPREVGERLNKEDLAHRDIFLILENEYGYSLGQAELKIEAMLADESLGKLLLVDKGSPVLRIERLTFTTDKQPLDFEYLYYRGDAFQYRLSVERGRI